MPPHPWLSWSLRLRGQRPQRVDRALWRLAWYCYGAVPSFKGSGWGLMPQPELPAGWARLEEEVWLGAGYRRRDYKNAQTGLRAMGFRDSQGHFVLAFRGTDDRRDWGSNADQAMGKASIQYEQAMDLTSRACASVGHDLVLTGHSLGGGLAAAGALATGATAVTFDASGLHPYTLAQAAARRGGDRTADDLVRDAAKGQIRAYHTSSDLLTALQENPNLSMPQAQGAPIVLDVPDTPTELGWRGVGLGAGAALGAAVGAALSQGHGPGTGIGTALGAVAGERLGGGLYAHLVGGIDVAMQRLFADLDRAAPSPDGESREPGNVADRVDVSS